jgi:hypothetical protein
MRSAGHSSRQRRDGPSIPIGATTRSGPINSPARLLPAAVRRKDGCGEAEFKNRGRRSVFGRPQPRFANRPIRRVPATVVCAGSPYFGSAGIVTFGATGAPIKTLLAQLLRRGLELMDCAERSCPALEDSSEAPLPRNRRTADEECRGRSPRSPFQGLARLSRKTVACTAGLLGRPEPAGHQSIRSRGEVRPRGGRAQGPSYPGNS